MDFSVAGSSLGVSIFHIMSSQIRNESDLGFIMSLLLPRPKARFAPRYTSFLICPASKNPGLNLFIVAGFFLSMGMFVFLFSIPTSNISHGMDQTLASYLPWTGAQHGGCHIMSLAT
jgi:hypothetical protein